MKHDHTQREVPSRHRRAAALTALGVVTALLLAGCSGGSATTREADRVSGGAPAQDGAGARPSPGALGAPEANGGSAARSVPDTPLSGAQVAPTDVPRADIRGPVAGVGTKLTKSASLDLQVRDVAAAATRVRSVATGLSAVVLGEQIGKGGPGDPEPLPSGDLSGAEPDPSGAKPGAEPSAEPGAEPSAEAGRGPDGDVVDSSGFGTLTLSVPEDKLDTALDQLARIGTVLRRNTSSQDVTAAYVDTESRLKTMRASVQRVRTLMAGAKDIGQVVTLEGELSRREADLESLQSQQIALKGNVERSTLTISLRTSDITPKIVAATGFLGGLRAGWDAFTGSASGLLTAIGATLPFAVFFAVLGTPLVLWWRRRETNRPASGHRPASELNG